VTGIYDLTPVYRSIFRIRRSGGIKQPLTLSWCVDFDDVSLARHERQTWEVGLPPSPLSSVFLRRWRPKNFEIHASRHEVSLIFTSARIGNPDFIGAHVLIFLAVDKICWYCVMASLLAHLDTSFLHRFNISIFYSNLFKFFTFSLKPKLHKIVYRRFCFAKGTQ